MRKRQLSDDAMGGPFYPMPILTVPFFQGLGFRVVFSLLLSKDEPALQGSSVTAAHRFANFVIQSLQGKSSRLIQALLMFRV